MGLDRKTTGGGGGGGETFAQTLALGNTTGGTDISISAEDKITFDSTGTNKVFVQNASGESIILDTGEIIISTDSGALNEGYLDVYSTGAELGFGVSSAFSAASTEADIFFNGAKRLNVTATEMNIGGALPINMDTESKLVFDATGTNKNFLEQSTGEVIISIDPTWDTGNGHLQISSDGTAGGDSKGYAWFGETATDLGFGFDTAFGGGIGFDATRLFFYNSLSVGGDIAYPWEIKDNRAGNVSQTGNTDSLPAFIGGFSNDINSGVLNALALGGQNITTDTDDTCHLANLNTKIDALGATTGTIDLDTAGNGITDGAYKTVTATGNITLNATTAYSTNNSAKWTLEFTQDAGGTNTLTLGTNFLTPGGVAITVSLGANDTDILKFETDSAGKHRLVEHRKAYA